jgi:hypothetical protein
MYFRKSFDPHTAIQSFGYFGMGESAWSSWLSQWHVTPAGGVSAAAVRDAGVRPVAVEFITSTTQTLMTDLLFK